VVELVVGAGFETRAAPAKNLHLTARKNRRRSQPRCYHYTKAPTNIDVISIGIGQFLVELLMFLM
jgi:hypothetical protein